MAKQGQQLQKKAAILQRQLEHADASCVPLVRGTLRNMRGLLRSRP